MDPTKALVLGPHHLEAPGAFVWFSMAWYAEANRPTGWDDEVLVLLPGRPRQPVEVPVRWWALGAGHTPRLEVFSDAWAALFSHEVLLGVLARTVGAPPPVLVAELLAVGFSDATPLEQN